MDWFDRWSRDRPDAPYLITPAGKVTYGEAAARMRDIAGALRDSYPSGARIGVLASPTVEMALTAMAVPYGGMTVVPLPANVPVAHRERLAAIAGTEAVVDRAPAGGRSMALGTPDPAGTHSAIFTSGSGGHPRPVRLTWTNVETSAAASAAHLDHGPDDRWLAVLPFHHVAGLSILTRSARQGGAVVLDGPFDAARAVGRLHAGDVTLGSFVSVMLERMLDVGLSAAPGFRHGLVGGGPASERALGAAGMSLLATYGMTETASQVATADPGDPRPDRLVILDGVQIRLGEGGRIVVSGPMVSPGDLDDPGVRTEVVTNDVGRLHGDQLEVLGRADEVIVSGGENVMPERVERLLSSVSNAGEVVVVGLPDERWGSLVAAAYTGPATSEDLSSAARALLAAHERPRRWLQVEAIPRLGIGKTDRRAVRALFD